MFRGFVSIFYCWLKLYETIILIYFYTFISGEKRDYSAAHEFIEYVDNLPNEFDWKSICDEIEF